MASAISFNIGLVVTAFLPMIFAAMALPGSTNIPLKVGAVAFGLTCVASLAARTAREPFRIRTDDLGKPDAVPAGEEEYKRSQAANPIALPGV